MKLNKRVVIYPYKFGSHSAKALQRYIKANGIRCLRVLPDGNYFPLKNDVIINWGNSNPPAWGNYHEHVAGKGKLINKIASVFIAHNKLRTFRVLKNLVPIPEFTQDGTEARLWEDVVCRKTLTGHSGQGIILWNRDDAGPESPIPDCPLYVKYIPKDKEYRVHVFRGKVIDVQQKRRNLDVPTEEVDYQVRSHGNGWVFARDNINPDNTVLQHSVGACSVLGLDFGAVDVIWNKKHKQAYILEVNTAPGLEGATIESYGNAILNELK